MKKNTRKSEKKYSHLTLEEREEIAIGLGNGMKQSEIALKIGPSALHHFQGIKEKLPFFKGSKI